MPLFALPPQDDYRVAHIYASPEYPTPLDSRQLFRAAALYAQGSGGRAQLVREAGGSDPARAAAAKLTMVNSGDPAFLPILLAKISSYDRGFDPYAARAVATYPRECWPILTRMARAGNPGATWAIGQYVTLGPPELRALWRSGNPRIQANVLDSTYGDATLERSGLDSASPLVVRAAVGALQLRHHSEWASYLTDRRPRVREAAAELADRWSDGSARMMAIWIKLARDPSPTMRKFALLHLGPIGLPWANGPWRQEAIRAVGMALRSPVASDRRSAILAARCWMVEWEHIGTLWDAPTIAMAERIFRTPAFRNAAYAEVCGKASDAMGLEIAPAFAALAIARDPRTVAVFRPRILADPLAHLDWIAALRYDPSPEAQRFLMELIRTALQTATGHHSAPEDNAAAPAAFRTLLEQRADVRPVSALLRSSSYSPVAKFALAMAAAQANLPAFTPTLGAFLKDRSWPPALRLSLMFAMTQNPDPRVGALLMDRAAHEPDSSLRRSAANALKAWLTSSPGRS